MKQFNDLLERNDLKVNKYTIKGRSMIVDTPLGQFALKKGNYNELYKYLLSRNFDYFPKMIDSSNNCSLYEYIDDVKYDDDQRALDLIHVVALLHSKTAYYKDADLDEYKDLYEKIMNKINYIYNYYLDTINVIESTIYMSPSDYLIARNISKIFSCIFYCKTELNKWYEMVKNKKRKRVVTLHNNLKLDNLVKSTKIYLLSWQKSCVDIPIYDFVNFYNMYALNFNFEALLNEYERIFPFLEEENVLFNVLISIPSKIQNCNREYEKVKNVRYVLDKIYKTESLLTPKEEEKGESA